MKGKIVCVLLCLCLVLNTFVIGAWAEGIPDWDIWLSAENVTPTGMTLKIARTGSAGGWLEYGDDYWLETYRAGTWMKMPFVRDVAFTCDLCGIMFPAGSTKDITEEIDWSGLYDPLSPGRYRFAREYKVISESGASHDRVYYAEFMIEGPHSCISLDADARCDLCGAVTEHDCVYGRNDTFCDLCGGPNPKVYVENPDWGIHLFVKDLTPTGMTLVITQAGGSYSGDLEYGSEYYIEIYKDGAWEAVPYLNSVGFTMESYLVATNANDDCDENWERMYGQLSPGRYRLVKEFTNYRETGYQGELFYADFIITEEHTCHSLDGGMICDTCLALVEHRSVDVNQDGRCDQCGMRDVYRVVGNASWMGNWDPSFDGGRMYYMADGSYRAKFQDVPPGSYELKVTKDGSWAESWGDEGGRNFCFTVVCNGELTVDLRFTEDGQGVIRVHGDGCSVGVGDGSADTGDRSLLPGMVLLCVCAPAVYLLLCRKKRTY